MSDRISKQDFVSRYIKDNELGLKSEDDYNRGYVALPCDCQEHGCLGWGTVPKQLSLIHQHCMTKCHETSNEKWETIMRAAEKYLLSIGPDHVRTAQLEGYIIDMEADIFSLPTVNETTLREFLKHQHTTFNQVSGTTEGHLTSDRQDFVQHLEKALFGNTDIYNSI